MTSESGRVALGTIKAVIEGTRIPHLASRKVNAYPLENVAGEDDTFICRLFLQEEDGGGNTIQDVRSTHLFKAYHYSPYETVSLVACQPFHHRLARPLQYDPSTRLSSRSRRVLNALSLKTIRRSSSSICACLLGAQRHSGRKQRR